MIQAKYKQIEKFSWEVKIKDNGVWITFIVKVSKRKHKKYDVFLKEKTKLKYVLSFGDNRYEQYRDRLGYYNAIDHNDLIRRNDYYKRHGSHNNNIYSAKWWSHTFLW